MKHGFKKIILIDPEDSRVIMKKEFYIYSLPSRLQRWLLFLKVHTGWRLQYLSDIKFRKAKTKNFAYENQSINEKPLVYSCSGCSNAAQMTNYIAVQLDRRGMAEMSCIAGVGGNVKKLVRTALSGRKIITIDGCPLACSRACLGNHSINSDGHFELTALGVKKKDHEDFDLAEANKLLKSIQQKVAELSGAT